MTRTGAETHTGTAAPNRIILAEPRGFCAGVRRAIAIVERALERHGPPVYVRKEIVHNPHVVRALTRRGARFVHTEHEVPEGAVCVFVFAAHGVSPRVRRNAAQRGPRVIDGTCPLVAKVHQQARRCDRAGRAILLVGHRDHEEVEGKQGEAPERTWVIESSAEIADLPLAPDTPVGYLNSNRMVEVAEDHGTPAYLLNDAADLAGSWLDDAGTIGVSAGAGAPEHLVEELLDRLTDFVFSLPPDSAPPT